MLTDDFLYDLPSDPYEAAEAFCKEFMSKHQSIHEHLRSSTYYDQYIEAYAATEAYLQANGIPFNPHALSTNRDKNVSMIIDFFSFLLFLNDWIVEKYKTS